MVGCHSAFCPIRFNQLFEVNFLLLRGNLKENKKTTAYIVARSFNTFYRQSSVWKFVENLSRKGNERFRTAHYLTKSFGLPSKDGNLNWIHRDFLSNFSVFVAKLPKSMIASL